MDARQRRPAAQRAVSLTPSAELARLRLGEGPPLVLLHGGAGPELTWADQHQLAARWTLVIPWRRGFWPSPAADHQDFEADAADIATLLEAEGGAHLVGFSYGGVGAALAAARRPGLVRSLTLIEPALLGVLPGDRQVRALVTLSAAALAGEAVSLVRFLDLAGLDDAGPERERTLARARGLRAPWTAQPDLEVLARARTPSLVLSGDDSPAIEKVCDAVTRRLGGRRLRLPGHGHAVQRSPRFDPALEAFSLRPSHTTARCPTAGRGNPMRPCGNWAGGGWLACRVVISTNQ